MTTSHDALPTEGPWTSSEILRRTGGNVYEVTVHGGAAVLSVAYAIGRSEREAKANARLIASAPALAEENARLRTALERAADQLELTADFIRDNYGLNGTVEGIMRDADEARAAFAQEEEHD